MAGLEDQVTQLRDSYEQKERRLIAERDEALQQARWVGLKNRNVQLLTLFGTMIVCCSEHN